MIYLKTVTLVTAKNMNSLLHARERIGKTDFQSLSLTEKGYFFFTGQKAERHKLQFARKSMRLSIFMGDFPLFPPF